MSKFEYDIFLSYKRGTAKEISAEEDRYKYLGVSVARMLKQAFTIEGYKVFFDCDLGVPPKEMLEEKIKKSRLVILLLTGYSFIYKGGQAVPSGGFETELNILSKLDNIVNVEKDGKTFNKNRKTTRVLALNIDETFDEINKDNNKYGDYSWVLSVAKLSHSKIRTANADDNNGECQLRLADNFDNDFKDLLNKVKGRRKVGEYNIRPRRPSIKKLKKRIKILVSSLIIACIILPVITLSWYKDRTTLITSSLLKNIITNEKKLKTCRIDMLVEYPPNKNIFDINYVEKPTDKNEKEQCPVVGVDDPMPVDELKKEHPEWFKDPYRLLEFDLGTVELVSYVFQKTSDTSITETALLEDLLRKKIFQKDTSYHVMMGLHQTGDKWLNILYKKYTDMYPDMLKKEPKSDSLSVEEFRDSLVDAKFRPYHGDYKAIIKEKTKINKTVIVFENTTVQKYIIDSIPVHAQIIKTKQDSLNLRAYTLVKYDATSNPNGGKIIYTNNQNQFFKQLKCPNYNVLTEKDFDYFENGHKVKDVIRREAGW